jgi:hypothetical protein
MEVPALLIFAEDFPRRNFGDWLAAHITFALPPHRYAGILAVKESGLLFSGTDTVEEKAVEIRIPRHRIEEVFIGYDEVYSVWQVRSLGFFWAPVRLKFTADTGQTSTLYLITGYDRLGTTNRDFYRFLTEWIS